MPKKGSTKTKPTATRTRKLTKKQTKLNDKKEILSRAKLPNGFQLTAQVAHLLKKYWRLFAGILIVYLLLNIIFASGISNIASNVASVKDSLNSNGTSAHPLAAGLGGFLALVVSAGASSSATGSVLQTVLIIIESLVIIWALRHVMAGHRVGVKESYYKSTAPLIPFLLVLAFIFIQLLPVTFGSAFLAAIAASLGTVSGVWTLVFGIVSLLLAAWSIYMVTGSIFAIYIITLPDVRPRMALRSAKKLVRFKRWLILSRLVFLPIIILAVMAIVVIPLILYATWLVVPVFYALSVGSLLFVHAYLYSLYRGLIA